MNLIEFYTEQGFKITSDPRKYASGIFGLRNYTVNGHNYDSYCDGYHRAVDLSKSHGANITAADDALVANGTRDYGTFGGQVVLIYERLEIQVIYAHVQRPVKLKPGQRVKKGDVIAKQGNTHNQGAGVSMASHLHLQVQYIEVLNEKDFTCKGIDPFKIDIEKPKKAKKQSVKVDDKKHLIIAGHGNQRDGSFDPGASGFITKGEHRYVRDDLFPAMKKYLPDGAKAVFYDARKVSNYGNLPQLVKQHNIDQVTEIHFDAATAQSARGGHVIIHTAYKPDAYDLRLRDSIDSMLGVRYSHRGFKGISGRNDLYNPNDARGIGVGYRMLELGFGTNRTDANIITGSVDEYAETIIQSLFLSSGGVSKSTARPAVPVTPPKVSPPKGNTPRTEGSWQRNQHGTQFIKAVGTFTVGNTRIMSRSRGPFISNPQGGWCYPGYKINYAYLIRQDGHVWIQYKQNGEWWFLPVRTWNSRTGAVGPAWGTFS